METLDNIMNMWEQDAHIDQTEPSKELLKIPLLHSKYLNILTRHKLASKKAENDYVKMKKIRWEYYTGKLSQEELNQYGWEPFQFTLKSDISIYIESDDHLIRLLQKKIIHDECVSVVKAIMDEIKNRSWELKSYIQWEMFINGQ